MEKYLDTFALLSTAIIIKYNLPDLERNKFFTIIIENIMASLIFDIEK